MPSIAATAIWMLSILAVSCAALNSPLALKHLFTAEFPIGEGANIGQGPYGFRTIAPIEGGQFAGPAMNGTILSGADWGLTDAQGRFTADIRMQLETEDGAAVYFTASGVLQEGNHLHAQIRFETGDEDYAWLNYVIAVGYSTLDKPPPPPLRSTFQVYEVASDAGD